MLKAMENIEKKVNETFQYLHEHPEISWEEVETTKYIANLLSKENVKVITFPDCPGVVGEIGNFDGSVPVVALRAELDALWQNVDGTFQANHSCGHDAHMSIVLGVFWKILQTPALFDRIAVKFIFQPAEEKGSGALKMIEKGVIDNVDYLFGIHLRPIHEMKFGFATPVLIHGATVNIDGVIEGDDAHGARPHLTHNAIEIGAQLVNFINQIHVDPSIPYSVKMTKFHAGGSSNIIPGNATFSLDLRAQTNEQMERLKNRVNEIIKNLGQLYNTKINIIHSEEIPAAVTNDEAIHIMKKAIEDVLGKEGTAPPVITPGGDDFHFYTIQKPNLKATLMGLGCDLTPGLHHPNMTFNKNALMIGVNILYKAILHTYHLSDKSGK